MSRLILLCAVLLGCAPEPMSGTGGGGGASGGGGGASASVDAGRPEGAACQASADCAAGLSCVTQVTASGASTRCAACATAGDACGDGGTCLSVLQGSSLSIVCSQGAPGEPCTSATHCRSGVCDTVVTAGGTSQRCQ